MKSVSARVRSARRAARLTQSELARLLGVGRSAVAQWERVDGSRPSVSHLTALAQELECSFEWLATGRGVRACPSDPDGQDAAVVLRHFAHDDSEERILVAVRSLDETDRAIVLGVADALAEKALSSRKHRRNGNGL